MKDKLIDSAIGDSGVITKTYSDLVQPTAKVVCSTLGRIISTALAPIRGLLWGWEKIEQVVNDGLEKRLANSSQEDIKTPEPEMAVPIFQALVYTAQNDTLREMFLNLLSNDMISSKKSIVHPSYVEIIKQMDKLDALTFLDLIQKNRTSFPAIHPKIFIQGTQSYLVNETPEWFLGWTINNCSIFDFSACIIRLGRLGLIDLLFERELSQISYRDIYTHPVLLEIAANYQINNPDKSLILGYTKQVISINNFGKRFAECCL